MTEILHSGVAHDDGPPGRGSGRYAWGSGENPHQHQFDFVSEVNRMRKTGLKDADIAKMMLGENAKTTDLRAEIAIQNNIKNQINYSTAAKLYDELGNVSEVARRMGRNESSIRSFLKNYADGKQDKYINTAEAIKKAVNEKGLVDIGSGVELYLGVTDSTKKVAIAMLEREGYVTTKTTIPQAGTDKNTTMLVMAPPGTEKSYIQQNKFNVKQIQEFSPSEGKQWFVPEYPESLDSSRIMIRYKEDGGQLKDGVIELRKGVEDISLGGSQYAQVRIAVDNSHYMKGMAIYADDADLPDGVDVIYNTNKKRGTPMMTDDDTSQVLKPMKRDANGEIDKDNPFGAAIKTPKDRDGVISAGGQRHYIGEDGKSHLSPINKLQDEGDWDSWSRNLSSQFLSKQPIKLIKQQMDLTTSEKRSELDDIMNLTNPVIKKKMLEDFANGCDANAADLSVRGFKNQSFQVLLPITSIGDNEIYAPNYDDGDEVALVRYPHGGTFEIPVLKVNNRHEGAKKVMENASDAVGISQRTAEILSGADFDGDTALVIPVKSNRLKIKHQDPLPGLVDFDAKSIYKLPDDAPKMTNKTKQTEMGKVTNLINDMTVGGASDREIERAVKHSMVVIDAEKHHLDYKKSYIDQDIDTLKRTYQGVNSKGQPKGASTILSRAGSEVYVDKYREVTDTSKMTPEELKRWNEGKKVIRSTEQKKLIQITDPDKMTEEERTRYNAGKKVYRESDKNKQVKVKQMDTVDDARDLVRDRTNEKEMAYADYANELKALANEARREYRRIKPTPVDQKAKETYKSEVASLNEKLRRARMNEPRERQAQAIMNAETSVKFKSNPDMDYEHRQREKARALNSARARVGAKKDRVVITDREWEAIQANAISTNKLTQILNNTDQEAFKKRATPRGQKTTMSDAKKSAARAMYNSGMYSMKEIAERFGISTSTVSSIVKG